MVRRGPRLRRLHHDPSDPPQYDADRVNDYDVNPIRDRRRSIDRRPALMGPEAEGFMPVPTVWADRPLLVSIPIYMTPAV